MKKLLSILVCVILMFNSCIKEDVIYSPMIMVDIGVIGYCVDNSGVIYKTNNSGQSWIESGSIVSSPDYINENGEIYASVWYFDGNISLYANYLYDFVGLNTVYKYPNYTHSLAATSGVNIFSYSITSGTEWSYVAEWNRETTILDFVNKDIGFVLSEDGDIFRYTSTTTAGWVRQGEIPNNWLFVDFVSPTTGYYVDSTTNNVYMTQDFNGDWSSTTCNWTNTGITPLDVMFVCFYNETIGYCVTNSGEIHKTTNSGMSWSVTGSIPENVIFIDFNS